MSERHGARAAEETRAAQQTSARRKPTTKGGAGPSAENAANLARRAAQPAEPQDRGLRRAIFLAELAEAKELRKRVAPRKARAAELHARLLRTFRY